MYQVHIFTYALGTTYAEQEDKIMRARRAKYVKFGVRGIRDMLPIMEAMPWGLWAYIAIKPLQEILVTTTSLKNSLGCILDRRGRLKVRVRRA